MDHLSTVRFGDGNALVGGRRYAENVVKLARSNQELECPSFRSFDAGRIHDRLTELRASSCPPAKSAQPDRSPSAGGVLRRLQRCVRGVVVASGGSWKCSAKHGANSFEHRSLQM